MEYTSRLGTVTYLDSTLLRTCVCEPSLLFILGLEAILSEDNDIHTINLSRYVNGTEIEVFDRILKYLYSDITFLPNNKVYDIDYSTDTIAYPCYGLKILFNELSNNLDTIPIIYHDYNNTAEIPDGTSHVDFIQNVFSFAGYHTKDTQLKLLGKFGISDKDTINYIDEQNADTVEYSHTKLEYSQIYKLFDYKAMYSYSLGVLYGCTYLGYDTSAIFHTDPSSWYSGDKVNLVTSAWTTFRFNYDSYTCYVNPDDHLFIKYKGIQVNNIWNYDNTGDDSIKQDEILCSSLYIEDNEIKSIPIIYSKSTGEPPGSYSHVDALHWQPIDSSVLDKTTKKGIAEQNKSFKRYIANDDIDIIKAYSYSKNKYLSPNTTDLYFVYTGNIGWTSFDENSYKSSSSTNPTPTIIPYTFDKIDSSLLDFVRKVSDNTIHAYYKCIVNSYTNLYGILSNEDSIVDGTIHVQKDAHFIEIVSDVDFNSNYNTDIVVDGYTLTSYYDLQNEISVFVYNEDTSLMWNGTDTPVPISDYGYTPTPSSRIASFIDSNGTLTEYDLRYNSEYGYWSTNFIKREWIPSITDNSIYEYNHDTSLYRASSIVSVERIYTQMATGTSNFIYNDYSIEYFTSLSHGFVTLDYLYTNAGITLYACEVIYKDDFGNSLLDEYGNPLVWYDESTSLYWNGVYEADVWQNNKPIRYISYMYDSLLNVESQIYDKSETDQIYIDGHFISYDDFYAVPNYGIIREKLLVFNESEEQVKYCYYDSYSDKYCIPTITEYWVSRADISNLGYRFVDGMQTLYLGDTVLNLVYDDNDED